MTGTLRAVWPITDPTMRRTDLIAEARADLPDLARRHGLVITGDIEHCTVRIARGEGIPGAGGFERVLIAEVAAETIRDHHRSTAA